MKRATLLFMFIVTFLSCKSLKVPNKESEIFKTLNSISYQNKKIINNSKSNNVVEDFLKTNTITTLETWKKSAPFLENFYTTECVGCSNKFGDFKPLYKLEKGSFVHFGFEKSMGIENLVFRKNGSFVTSFFTYQGYSKNQIRDELRKDQDRWNVIAGIYPAKITRKEIYLDHTDYTDQTHNGEWFNTTFPMSLRYYINLKEKSPLIRFQFCGGFYSYQKKQENGSLRMIHFFEPKFEKNEVGSKGLAIQSTQEYGYSGGAIFFLITLEEKMKLFIEIKPEIEGYEPEFSVFRNDQFYTIDEYINKDHKLCTSYSKTLKKGEYLIRVINENPIDLFTPLFNLKVTKQL
ncbi:hypothetical protein ACWGOQ_0016400 [Aquimarina sp. M1]